MSLDADLKSDATRCSGCGYHPTQGCACVGTVRKARGIARATDNASPDARAAIDAAIRTVAARGQVFSANDVRALVPGARGPLMGARFHAAAKAGVITRVGYEPSTSARTHAHPIAQWRGVAA